METYTPQQKLPPTSNHQHTYLVLIYPDKQEHLTHRWHIGFYLEGLQEWRVLGSNSTIKVSHWQELPPSPWILPLEKNDMDQEIVQTLTKLAFTTKDGYTTKPGDTLYHNSYTPIAIAQQDGTAKIPMYNTILITECYYKIENLPRNQKLTNQEK